MGELSQAGGTALGATIGGVLGLAGNAIASAQNDKYARQQMALQHEYNEDSANRADERTRALYNDLYSPQAQMQQIKDAGLSPSAMYAQGLGGGQGQAGAQAGAVGNAGGTGFPMDIAGASAEWAQVIANTRLANAQATKTEKEAGQVDNLANAQVSNLLAQAGLAGAEKSLKESETTWQNLQNDLMNDTYDAQRETIESQAEMMLQQSYIAQQQAEQEKVKTYVTQQTAETQVMQIEKDLEETIARITKAKTGAELDRAQIKSLIEHIDIDKFNAKTNRRSVLQAYRIADMQLQQATKELEFQKEKMWVELGEDVIHTIGNICAAARFSQVALSKATSGGMNTIKGALKKHHTSAIDPNRGLKQEHAKRIHVADK